MNSRITKYNLKNGENHVLDLFDLTVKKMIWFFQENNLVNYKKFKKNCILVCYYTKTIMVLGTPIVVSSNMMITMCYQKLVILVKHLVLEICNNSNIMSPIPSFSFFSCSISID